MAQTSTAPRNVTIQGAVFELADVYAEGHVCSPMEAKALNQTRSENIRNNFAGRVKEAKGDAESLPDAAKNKLQTELNDYATKYEFSVGIGGARLDPIQKEAKQIAVTLVDGVIAKSGTSVKAYKDTKGKDKYDALVADVMEREDVVKKAEKIVKEREALAASIEI